MRPDWDAMTSFLALLFFFFEKLPVHFITLIIDVSFTTNFTYGSSLSNFFFLFMVKVFSYNHPLTIYSHFCCGQLCGGFFSASPSFAQKA